MKTLVEMSKPEKRAMLDALGRCVAAALPEDAGYIVAVLAPDGHVNFVSNIDSDQVADILDQTANQTRLIMNTRN
jgi:hypothetical protein